jgi:hypothetical protein
VGEPASYEVDRVFNTDGSKIRDAVVVLKTAKLEGDS